MQVQGRAGLLLHLPGREEVIQMGVRVDDAHHLEPMLIQTRHDQLGIAARIDDDGLFRHRIADDRAVALQRADGECFTDQRRRVIHGSGFQNGLKLDPDA